MRDDQITSEVKRQLIAKQRAHWLQLGKPDFDFDKLDEVVDHIDNFYVIAENLLDASDAKFERFFEKLYRLDKRILLFYILKNRDRITPQQFAFAKEYFNERDKINWAKAKNLLLKF